MTYKVAIPTYKRSNELIKKTLKTLKDGGVNKDKIYIFLANKDEKKAYEDVVPKDLYNKMVVGIKGIANQRNFIRNYFKNGEKIVSIDDDVQEVSKLSGDKLVKVTNLDVFFRRAFEKLTKNKLYLWGVYPVSNPFFMKGVKEAESKSLKFIIGVLHGFIVRHDKKLLTSTSAEGKEDYEMSILNYLKDGGVYRFNHVTIKTKFNAPGGLGQDRFDMNKKAAEYLEKKYPDLITIFHRKNGMTEVRLRDSNLKKKENNKTIKKGGKKKRKTRKLK